jgi:hypothetical protein
VVFQGNRRRKSKLLPDGADTSCRRAIAGEDVAVRCTQDGMDPILFWLLRSSGRVITPRAGNHDGGH